MRTVPNSKIVYYRRNCLDFGMLFIFAALSAF